MSDKKLLAKAVLFSSVCGILILVILMCLLAAVMMSSGVISADILDYCTVGMVGVATLMSGIISSRITEPSLSHSPDYCTILRAVLP